MATVDEALAAAAQVEKILKAAQLRLQDLNGAISGASGSRARDEAKAIAHQLGEQAETFTQQGECALESDNQASEVAFNALAHILLDAQNEIEHAVHEGEDDHGVIPEVLSGIRKIVEEAEATRGRLEQAAARPPPPPQSSTRAPSTAMKWVAADYEGGPLRARVEALEVLKEVHPSKLLNVVTVLGPARKGKSFLMNALAGRNGVFPVSPAVVPCTTGADLSPILMPLPSFAQLGREEEFDRSAPAPDSPTIAFVDLEGQGDKSVEHGVRLATTFLVLSKVIIYNWLQLPNKQTMLNELVVMTKAADKVLREDKEGGHGDQNGEANGEETPSFGHLIILLRDVQGKAEEIEDLVLGKEQTRGLKHDEKLEAGRRNIIREGLESAFESITFHTMPRPHLKIADGAVPLSDVVSGFTTSLNELRGTIAEHLATGHQFAGKEIAGGERLHTTVVHLCDAINRTGDICPPSVLVAIETRLADAEVQKAVVRFDNVMGPTLGGRFPLTSQETTNAIVNAKDNALKLFDEATQGITASIAEGKRVEVEKQIALKAEVATHNQEQRRHGLKRKMDSLASQHKASIAEKAKSLGFPLDEKDLEKEWSKLVSLCFATLDRAIKSTVTRTLETGDEEVHQDLLEDLGWASSRKDFEASVKDTHRFIQELNNSAIAGKKDRKAREEAKKKLDQLTEQVESTKREVEAAQAQAKKAQKAANDAQSRAAREASQSQSSLGMMMMALMGGGGGIGGGGGYGYPAMGGGYPGMSGGYSGYSSGGMGGGRFYAGGQFIPGGGRAPRGGCFIG